MRATAAAALVTIMCGAAAAQPTGAPVTVVYGDDADPTSTLSASWSNPSWSGETGVWTAAAGMPAYHELVVASNWMKMALLRLDHDDSLSLMQWDGSVWGAAQTLTADAGTHSSKVAAAAFEQTTHELLTVYRQGDTPTLRYRSYSTASPSEQNLSLGLTEEPRWITLAPRPATDDLLLLVATRSRLYAAIWDGSSFGSTTTLETALYNQGRPMDGVFTTQSGHAMVVWGPSSGAARYRVWTGATWGSPGTLSSLTTGPRWVALAANPRIDRDEVLVTMIDRGRDVELTSWNGSNWGPVIELDNEVASSTQGRLDVAYQPDGLRAVAAWHRTGQNSLRYKTWNGVSWSSTLTGPNMQSETQYVALVPGRQPTELVMAAWCRRVVGGSGPGGRRLSQYVLYAENGSLNLTGTVVNAPSGDDVHGVYLPDAPSGSAGSTDLNYADSAIATIAPGSYRNLVAGSGVRLTFSPGTHRFQSVTVGPSAELRFYAADDDVDVIVTTGNWQCGDGAELLNTGTDRVTIHVRNGNFQLGSGATITSCDVLTYDGNIDIGGSATVSGLLYAESNIVMGTGTVSRPPYFPGEVGRVAAVVWTDTVPGAVTELVDDTPYASVTGAIAIGALPPRVRPRVTAWEEIDPATAP